MSTSHEFSFRSVAYELSRRRRPIPKARKACLSSSAVMLGAAFLLAAGTPRTNGARLAAARHPPKRDLSSPGLAALLTRLRLRRGTTEPEHQTAVRQGLEVGRVEAIGSQRLDLRC